MSNTISVSPATLTFTELVTLWEANGGTPESASTAAAIALAESSGCRYALAGPVDVRPVPECVYRKTSTENSFGLWQINLDAHPGLKGTDLFDPKQNAIAAVSISGAGSGFTAWSTYTDGSFRQFLPSPGGTPSPTPDTMGPPAPAKRTLPGSGGPSDAGTDPGTPANALDSLDGFGAALGYWLPHGLQRARTASRRFQRAVR